MSHAQKCPICNGEGSIPMPGYEQTTGTMTKTCHGCGGTGWVTVGGD